MKHRLPRTSPKRWSSNSRLLQTVSMYHSDLFTVFRVIGDAEDKWDNDSVMKAAGFERWLLKTNTCFLIMAYEEIFNETEALFRVLQNKLMDITLSANKYATPSIMLSDEDKSLTVSMTDLSRNVQHFILLTPAICVK